MKKENQLLIGEEKSIYTDCMYLLISNRLCTQLAHDRKHLHRDRHTDTHTHTHTHTGVKLFVCRREQKVPAVHKKISP